MLVGFLDWDGTGLAKLVNMLTSTHELLQKSYENHIYYDKTWLLIIIFFNEPFPEANSSKMFQDFPAELKEDLASEPLTENSHKWSVTTSVRHSLLLWWENSSVIKVTHNMCKIREELTSMFLADFQLNWGAEGVLQSSLHEYRRTSRVCVNNGR